MWKASLFLMVGAWLGGCYAKVGRVGAGTASKSARPCAVPRDNLPSATAIQPLWPPSLGEFDLADNSPSEPIDPDAEFDDYIIPTASPLLEPRSALKRYLDKYERDLSDSADGPAASTAQAVISASVIQHNGTNDTYATFSLQDDGYSLILSVANEMSATACAYDAFEAANTAQARLNERDTEGPDGNPTVTLRNQIPLCGIDEGQAKDLWNFTVNLLINKSAITIHDGDSSVSQSQSSAELKAIAEKVADNIVAVFLNPLPECLNSEEELNEALEQAKEKICSQHVTISSLSDIGFTDGALDILFYGAASPNCCYTKTPRPQRIIIQNIAAANQYEVECKKTSWETTNANGQEETTTACKYPLNLLTIQASPTYYGNTVTPPGLCITSKEVTMNGKTSELSWPCDLPEPTTGTPSTETTATQTPSVQARHRK